MLVVDHDFVVIGVDNYNQACEHREPESNAWIKLFGFVPFCLAQVEGLGLLRLQLVEVANLTTELILAAYAIWRTVLHLNFD